MRKSLNDLARTVGIPTHVVRETKNPKKVPECKAKTIRQAQVAYNKAHQGTARQAAVLKRWEELCLQELDSVRTCEEGMSLLDRTPEDTDAERAVFQKCLLLCSNGAEAYQLCGMAENNTVYENAALQKWLQVCTSPEEAEELFQEAPDSFEGQIMRKWLDLCTDIEELERLHHFAKRKYATLVRQKMIEIWLAS